MTTFFRKGGFHQPHVILDTVNTCCAQCIHVVVPIFLEICEFGIESHRKENVFSSKHNFRGENELALHP